MTGGRGGHRLEPARAARPIDPGERIHIVGAAGAGASAAAALAHAAGAVVTACDPAGGSPYTAALAARGIEVAEAHDPAHVVRAGEPIVTRLGVTKALTAIDPDHPELRAARSARVPVEPWQQVVADAAASQGGRLVAVAGTHGKSTTAGWLVHALVAAGRDPGAFVGALLPSALTGGPPSTARWGRGDAIVVEADEYAGNFDAFRPALAIVLNADWDHPDVFADRDAVVDAFVTWLRRPGWQARQVVVNTGDAGGREVADRISGQAIRTLTVGPAGDPGARVTWRLTPGGLRVDGLADATVTSPLRLPGEHNAANAACVAAAANLLGLSAAEIEHALTTFEGVGRRLEIRGEVRGIVVIDDYAHHPTAISATIASVRERWPGRRLWAVLEPLTFHRTAAMLRPLAEALAAADEVVIADIWPGRDRDTAIASARGLADVVSANSGRIVTAPGSPEATADHLLPRLRAGDVVLVMGGGRSYVIAERLTAGLSTLDRG